MPIFAGNIVHGLRWITMLINAGVVFLRDHNVRHDPPVNLGGILRLLGKAEDAKQPPTIKVDLGLDIPKLQPGRAYYLSHHLLAD